VQLGLDLGLSQVADTLQHLGLETRPTLNPSMLLGTVEMTPLEVVQIYRNAVTHLPRGTVVAGKTGTSFDTRDSWFAGFTGSYLAVVWVGYDDNRATGLTGAAEGLPVWGGDAGPPEVGATLDRALRIEPNNPLLWVERGKLRLAENDAHQAEGCGRKALALASGDRSAQRQAGRLLADALRAQQRNPEAHAVESAPYMN